MTTYENIRIKLDDKALDEANKKMANFTKLMQGAELNNVSEGTKKKLQAIEKSLEKQVLWKEKSLKTQKQIDKYFLKQAKQEERKAKMDAFKEKHPLLYNGANKIINTISSKIVGLFRSIWTGILSDAKQMLSEKGVASYNMGTSLFTNAQAREMSMKYGLGAGQTYALDQTMKMLGMNSDEDLMYMNTAQKEKFNELMNKYSAWYDKMESTGFLQNVQEAQLELKMFKQEVAMKFMNWFAEHKDVIMAVIKGTLKVLETLANAVFKILSFFHIGSSGATSSALSSEQLNNATNNNSTNVGINNTVNANVTTSSQVDAENFGRDVAEGSIRLYNQMVNTL